MTEETDLPSIDDLFARDPLKLTDQDIDRIIEKMRSARLSYEAGNKKATKKKATKTAETTETSENLLKELGL